jgi:hypothetical protein
MAGVKPWNGKKKPVTLVAPVVARNRTAQRSSRFWASIPNMTTKPERIPIRLIATCIAVNVSLMPSG